VDYQIAESIMRQWFRGKSVNERYGQINDSELVMVIDKVTFDHGETEIFVAQKKSRSPGTKCEHFVNIDGDRKQKRTQHCPESLMISGTP
jgi:hypothetical protein